MEKSKIQKPTNERRGEVIKEFLKKTKATSTDSTLSGLFQELNSQLNVWDKLFNSPDKYWSYLRFLNHSPIFDIPRLIASKIMRGITGKGIRFSSIDDNLTEEITKWMKNDRWDIKIKKAMELASLFGNGIFFLLPVYNEILKKDEWTLAYSPLVYNGFVSSINSNEETAVIFWYGDDIVNFPIYRIRIDKHNYFIDKMNYSDELIYNIDGSTTPRTIKYETKYAFKTPLNVLPCKIFYNRFFTTLIANGGNQNNNEWTGRDTDVGDCYHLIYLFQYYYLIFQREIGNNRSRLHGRLSEDMISEIKNGSIPYRDYDLFINSAANVNRNYNSITENSLVAIGSTFKASEYGMAAETILSHIYRSINLSFNEETTNTYQNKMKTQNSNAISKELILSKRESLFECLIFLIEIYAQLYLKKPMNKKIHAFTLSVDEIISDDINIANVRVDTRLANYTISHVQAIAELEGIDIKEAENKFKKILEEISKLGELGINTRAAKNNNTTENTNSQTKEDSVMKDKLSVR